MTQTPEEKTRVQVLPHFSRKPGLLLVEVHGWSGTQLGVLKVTRTVNGPLGIDEAVTDMCLEHGIEEP